MEPLTVKYKYGNRSDFYSTLKQRVDQYFIDNNTTKFANGLMVAKTIFFFSMVAVSYGLIISGIFAPWQMLILAIIFGMSSAFFVFNVAHDASHGAYSPNPKVNSFLSYVWNLVGLSSYMWDLKHNISHHTYTNVNGADVDIDQGFLLRFHPMAKRKPHHRLQHIYAPILYGLFSIYAILIKDFQLYTTKRFGNKVITGHHWGQYLILILSKVIYISYSLIIPYVLLDITIWQLLFAFFMMHMMIGNIMAFILTPVHVTHGTDFVEPNAKGEIDSSWAVHQINCTKDFAAESRLVNWFAGGLNTHVAHHIFPTICHIHYLDLTKIIKQTAKDFGIEYTNLSLLGSVKNHLSFLKALGREDDPGGALTV